MSNLVRMSAAYSYRSCHSAVWLLNTTTAHEAMSIRAGQKETMAILALSREREELEWSVTTPKRMLGPEAAHASASKGTMGLFSRLGVRGGLEGGGAEWRVGREGKSTVLKASQTEQDTTYQSQLSFDSRALLRTFFDLRLPYLDIKQAMCPEVPVSDILPKFTLSSGGTNQPSTRRGPLFRSSTLI
eukprot:scaffold68994_cov28-Tisochrysis_lutea.AAC.7